MDEDRFLLVEDEPAVARTIVRAMACDGAIEIVTSCAEGLARASTESRRWLGAIVDVGLPDGSGLDVAEQLRRRDPRLHLLILTAQVSFEHLRRAYDLRASYLLKPPERAALRDFAFRARSMGDPLSPAARRWADRYALSPSEGQLLHLALERRSRHQLAFERGIESRIEKQIATLLEKTGDESLEAAVGRLLREELRQR